TKRYGCIATEGSRTSLRSGSRRMAVCAGAARCASDRLRAMTVCRNGAGSLCRCGASRPGIATPRGGSSVPRMAWGGGRFPGVTANVRETGKVFQTSWESVYRSVEWFVQWGLAHRQLLGVEALGVDEIHWGHGLRAENFLTVIYQIDASCRRLLWVGKRRSEATLRRGLKALGPEVVQG